MVPGWQAPGMGAALSLAGEGGGSRDGNTGSGLLLEVRKRREISSIRKIPTTGSRSLSALKAES